MSGQINCPVSVALQSSHPIWPPNWDPIQQEIGDPIQKWSNVSASYQTFPIAHPHPDLQACSETCHQPTGVCEYDVQWTRVNQHSTVGKSSWRDVSATDMSLKTEVAAKRNASSSIQGCILTHTDTPTHTHTHPTHPTPNPSSFLTTSTVTVDYSMHHSTLIAHIMQCHWQCAVYAELQLISVSSMWHLAGQSNLPNPSFPEIDFSSSR